MREAKRAKWPYSTVECARRTVLSGSPLQGDETKAHSKVSFNKYGGTAFFTVLPKMNFLLCDHFCWLR